MSRRPLPVPPCTSRCPQCGGRCALAAELHVIMKHRCKLRHTWQR